MLLCVKNCTTPQYASTICGVLTAQNTSSLYGVGARNVLVTEWLILCVCNACALAFTGHAVCFSKQFTRTALLKLVLLFYKTPFQVQPLLAKTDALKHGFRLFFSLAHFILHPFWVSKYQFAPFYLSIWCQDGNFSSPQKPVLVYKKQIFGDVFTKIKYHSTLYCKDLRAVKNAFCTI